MMGSNAAVQRVNVDGLPLLPTFSHATVAHGDVLISGMLGLEVATMTVPDDFEAEAGIALKNLFAVLTACGCGANDVLKVTVYLKDLDDFARMDAAYRAIFGEAKPARTTVGVGALAFGARIEVDCTAKVRVTAVSS